ncbi:hypothetical protein ASPTUDRAFT_59144 [Aspergillus tubingensis CBS 134.48]|uniref:FAD/NAD(P)-binding domain-containing protein n=1 Tax=Aspergillus tubingensis (strain CBS 134.48) TaxID=767770 RepID=A0A1L9MTQ0_ASPTC|nr:hypothetical protein ASPTUDRAFT_59144 [Aspergillus tubingensis CBS 134.48]
MPVYTQTQPNFDAIVVGAGFGGIYMCKKLTDQGLSVKVIEAAPDVGGTWYWNRYPGALSDTRSYFYRYSWDLEDLREYPWKREYLKQPEILAYLRHVVERHNLRKHMQFNTEMQRAIYDDVDNLWTTYEGEVYHTGNWPASYDFTGKRVGVIGNGSSGVQLQLLSFQRHSQYVVPAGDAEVPAATRAKLDERWEQVWGEVRNSILGFGFEESSKPIFSVSEEERQRIFEDAWAKGNGFYFMFGTFCDIFSDEEANKAAAEFIRRKIRQKVRDPVKAEKLMPYDWYARRLLCDTGYYEKFNRLNVDVVNIGTHPIIQIIDKGVRTADGSEYELDVLIFAIGFDAVDGNYKRMHIQGALGDTIKDRWKEEPSLFLGTCIPGFPNLFTVLGPNGPFTNIPPLIEIQVEFISDMISHARKMAAAQSVVNGPRVEADTTSFQAWMQQCDEASANSLFRKTPSWIFGANVAGKKPSVLFYFGGLATYRRILEKIVEQNYKGFSLF